MKSNITLGQIIDAANASATLEGVDQEIVKLVGAAFWAGEAKARADEREAAKLANLEIRPGRYWRIVAAAVNAILPNCKAIPGLREEVAEFRAWDFQL